MMLILIIHFRNIPRSLAIAVPAVTGIYVMMNVAYMTVLSTEEMLKAPAVAVVSWRICEL